jgi:hypothetical protein
MFTADSFADSLLSLSFRLEFVSPQPKRFQLELRSRRRAGGEQEGEPTALAAKARKSTLLLRRTEHQPIARVAGKTPRRWARIVLKYRTVTGHDMRTPVDDQKGRNAEDTSVEVIIVTTRRGRRGNDGGYHSIRMYFKHATDGVGSETTSLSLRSMRLMRPFAMV